MKSLIYCFVLLLIISNIFIIVSEKIQLSPVISLIFFGIIISFSSTFKNFVKPHSEKINLLGDIGLIFLMFIAGLESSALRLKNNIKDTAIISATSGIFAFSLGFIFSKLMGYSYIVSAIIGICFFVTAESINAKVLMEENIANTDSGSIVIGAGLIDDILGIVIFSVILFFIGNHHSHSKEYIVLFLILFVFIMALIYQKKIKSGINYNIFEKISMHLIIPFFFISMGMHLNIGKNLNYKFLFFFILLAIIGKVGGTLIAKPFVKPSLEQLHIIGWALNARGGIGIALAIIAFRNKLINNFLYNAIILMVIITSLLFPIAIKFFFKPQYVKKQFNKNLIEL